MTAGRDPRQLDDEAIARLRLLRSAHVGPVSYYQLLARFGSGAAALAALPDLVRRGGGRAVRIATPADIAQEAEALARAGGVYLFHDDPGYPLWLRALDNAPPVLGVAGSPALLEQPALGIVGARNASAAACRLARQWSAQLADRGFVLVSGLARGIDTAVHRGAFDLAGEAGMAATIGVIASGLDIAYPPENAGLQRAMAERALVIAEQPPGTEPLARHFPYRNRIIAGLSIGTLVVEAAPRSGSLITARLAAEAGREVMAVPGSPLDSRAQGCNALIRNGATLVQSVDDVVEALGPIDPLLAHARRLPPGPPPALAEPRPGPVPCLAASDDAARDGLTALLGPVPVAVDELVRQSGLAPADAQIVLLELELAGRIERHAAGRVSLV